MLFGVPSVETSRCFPKHPLETPRRPLERIFCIIGAMDTLLSVVTVSEAARMYEKNVRSVRRAIESRHKPLEARQSGRDWLITVDSLRRRWGAPKHPVDTSTLACPL